MNEDEYYAIIGFINRNKKSDGYISEIGLRKFINKLRTEERIRKVKKALRELRK